jgi:hypothetical protein
VDRLSWDNYLDSFIYLLNSQASGSFRIAPFSLISEAFQWRKLAPLWLLLSQIDHTTKVLYRRVHDFYSTAMRHDLYGFGMSFFSLQMAIGSKKRQTKGQNLCVAN